MRIQHNIMAMNAYRNYTNNVSAMKKNLEKLSSGYKINRAGDDAAGLAISEKMRAQITGLQTAQKNAKDGISLVQTAEGALTEVHDMLNRMVELATQSANGTYDNDVDRNQMQKEVNQLLSEIDRIADSSNFNGINLLDGTLGLDTKTYTIDNVAEVEAQAVDGFNTAILPTAANPVVPTNTILHADGTSAQLGEFTIDLQQVTVGSVSSNANANFKLKIGGATIAALTLTGTANKGKSLDAKTMAKLIADKFTGATSSTALYIKGADGSFSSTLATSSLYMKATDNWDGTVKFEIAGYVAKGGTSLTAKGTKTAKDIMDAVGSNAANKALDVNVTVAAGTAGTVTRGENVGTIDIINNKKAVAGKLGNTELTLDMTKVKDGDVLTIAGEEYTFAIGKNSTVDTKGANVIDLTGIVKDATDLKGTLTTTQQNDIMAKITDATAGNKTLNVGSQAWNKLSLTEKSDGQGNSAASVEEKWKKAMGSKDTFQKMVSLETPAQKAGQSVSGTPKDDTSLTIGGKRFTFTKDGKDNGTGADVYIKTGDGMQGLSDALKAEGIAHEFDGTNKITVRGGAILGKGLTLQIGDTSDSFNQLNVAVQDMHAVSLGLEGLEINTEEKAQLAIKKIKDAINTVSDVRGTLGATQNRLDHTINNLSVMTENIQDAESTIRDTDVAEEMMAYTKNNILIQSAQAMLAQANQVPQGVLQLLQ